MNETLNKQETLNELQEALGREGMFEGSTHYWSVGARTWIELYDDCY